MAILQFLAIALFATAVNGASLLSEEARNLANPGPLLKRCPCVPINTCYAQGVSLNEQDFLNTHFECPDYTQNHCCGPYFPTLGSDDFYFDDPGQGKLLAGFSNTGERVMIVMAQNATTEDPPELKTTNRVMTVLPEVSSTTTESTTTEVHDSSATTVEVETTTEALTEPTTTTEIVTTTTTVKPKVRLPKTHSRRVLPRFERKSTRKSSTVTEPATMSATLPASSSTATTETLRKFPTRRTVYRSEIRQRLIGSRFRSTTTSTTVAITE